MKVAVSDLRDSAIRLLLGTGMAEDDAALAAQCLIQADAWGIHTHGVKNLKGYLPRLKAGGIQPRARPEVVAEGAAWARINAHHALGMIGSACAMELAVEKARLAGLSMVTVYNSCHFGAAGVYSHMAARKGMLGIAMANDTPTMSVPGSAGPVLGSNPFSFACPAGDQIILFDIASSTVAGGKVFQAAAEEKKVPKGWLVDREGRAVTRPQRFLKDAWLTPFASHKGYGFALMVEILSGILSGAATTHGVLSFAFEPPEKHTYHGACFMAVDPQSLIGAEAFETAAVELVQDIKNNSHSILLPGEKEFGLERGQVENQMDLPDDLVKMMTDLVEKNP